RDGIARVLPHYRPGHRHYGYVQGMYAFGLEEAGDYAAAERHGKIAVGENPGDAWSVHAVAHAFEMTGRGEEGLAFTAALEPDWGQVNNFRYHLHWHRGLYLLEQNRTAEVLALYDAEVGADPDSGFYLDMLNCSSMLWRLEMQGVDVGDRWQALAGVAAKRSGEEELIFVTLHYAMALIAAGRPGQIDALEAHLEAWAAKPTTQGAIVAAVGLPLFRAMRLLRVGRAGEALAALLPLRYAIDPIGGSHAQRDVFQMALITAAEAAGQPRMARALLAERVALKPHGCWGWQRYAAALRSVGERAAAEAAETRAADAAAGRLVAA
ncbi:MAG: tetratricopeptide repeat protein, partial [Pseudomonadota bacterium]